MIRRPPRSTRSPSRGLGDVYKRQVETGAEKLIVEIKARNELADEIVQAKARAACEWVKYANQHAQENSGKSWGYLLVPGDTITESATLAGLAAAHRQE